MAREMSKTWEAFQVKECGQQHQILVRGLRSSRGMEALDLAMWRPLAPLATEEGVGARLESRGH